MAFDNLREYKYHFTSCAGLYGMLKDYSMDNPYLTMWATHSSFMNDPTEYEYGKDMCQKVLKLYEEKEGIAKTNRSIFRVAKKQISKFMSNDAPYLISLSKNIDSAAMWSMYSSNGSGIALKFDISTLNRYMNSNSGCVSMTECIYHKTAKEILDDNGAYIKVMHDIMYAQIKKYNNDSLPKVLLIDLAAQIKHSSYAYENEYRLVIEKKDNPVGFRIRNNVIIPYIEVKIPIEALWGIIIGPTANYEYIKKSLEVFLSNLGDNTAINRIIKNIKSSDVPYRG